MNRFLLALTCLVVWGCSNTDEIDRKSDIIVNQPNADSRVNSNNRCGLRGMSFSYKDNPKQLIYDISCDIVNDSIVECWVPYIIEDKKLIASFDYVGDSLCLDGQKWSAGYKHDFSKPVRLTITQDSVHITYYIFVHSYTGLPRVYIETKNRNEIVSKVDYLDASFRMIEDVVTRGPGEIVTSDIQIRGRGNATWDSYGEKKPYRLKFPHKISLFDGANEKSYVLLANAIDKTSLRNNIAFYMSRISTLDYTPNFHFVDLYLNGNYYGLYMLGDKLSISEHRVNVGKDGFLMEIDSRAYDEDDAVFFEVNNLKHPKMSMINTVTEDELQYVAAPINIKEPKVEYGDEKYNYLKGFVSEADSVLFSRNFTDPIIGWQKYIDMDSFVDWFWINELSRNGDALFYTSCWMHLKPGGKLTMGPVWDFDTAFGNNYTRTTKPAEGFYIMKYASWYKRLFQDPVFVKRAKERFSFFYENKDLIYNDMSESAEYIKRSIIENNNRWNNLYVQNFRHQEIWGGYYNEVQYLKNWLDRRFEWFKNELGNNW